MDLIITKKLELCLDKPQKNKITSFIPSKLKAEDRKNILDGLSQYVAQDMRVFREVVCPGFQHFVKTVIDIIGRRIS